MRELQRFRPPAAAGISPTSWTWLGPGNIGGRVRSLVIDPTTPSTWFAGSVSGGIWRTTNSGDNWAPVDDFMANLAVSTMVMHPGAPGTIYAGTGEGVGSADSLTGAGIFKSTDGGLTWPQLPATAGPSFRFVNRLAMSPNGAVLLAATRSGLFRSLDGGASFSLVLASPGGLGLMDVEFHPTDSARAVASSRNGSAWRSTDGGASWVAASGLPGAGRAEIAYAPSSPSTIYASVDVANGSLYRSDDGGASYSLVFNGTPDYLGGIGWYANLLWVDPTNPAFLIVGAVDLWKSTDAGATFTKISSWQYSPASAHADNHAAVALPGFNGSSNRSVVFVNDGGVYMTQDVYTVGGGTGNTAGWIEKNNNLGITQYYGAAGNASTGTIVGGTQDNGTIRFTVAGGPEGHVEMFGGDGGFGAADPDDSNYFYGEYVHLQIHRSTDGGATAQYIYAGISDAGTTNSNFVAPFILDPNDSNRMLAGGARLWRSSNLKAATPAWSSIKASIGSNISAIAITPGNANLCWVGHNNGDVYRSTDCVASAPAWTRVDQNGAGLPNRMVTRITIDPADAARVYVTFGGFSGDNVWRTPDAGASWTDVTGLGATGLPDVPVRDLDVHPADPHLLYAATEVGIFTSEDMGVTWQVPHDGPSNVSVDELFWMGSNLVAATHGRGLFKATPGTCETVSTVRTGGAGVSGPPASDPTGMGSTSASNTPLAGGLPDGGSWTRELRPGGETWTYRFTVGGQSPAESATETAARRRSDPDGPPVERLISQRFPTETDPRHPTAQGIEAGAVYDVWFDGTAVVPELAALNPTGEAGAIRLRLEADALAAVRRNGLRHVRVTSGELAGAPAAGNIGAQRSDATAFVARLASRGDLARGTSGAPGLSAFDVSFEDVGQPLEVTSARLALSVDHPALDEVTIWLAAGDREVVLWDARGGSDDGGWDDDPEQDSTIRLDRVIGDALAGLVVEGRWTLYVSTGAESPGVLESAWLMVGAAPIVSGASGDRIAAATLDIEALRAYLRTATGAGTEVDTPTIGQTVYFHVDWRVTGAGPAITSSVRAWLDGSVFCAGNWSTTPGASWATWCLDGWVATGGTHTLTWELDYTNAVEETSESNNAASKVFAPTTAGIDIEAQRAYLQTAANGGSEVDVPGVGQAVYFHLDWRVVGSGSPIAFDLRALLDGASFCAGSSSVSPGTAWIQWCVNPWVATAGAHTLTWELDYTNAVAEGNESNNSASKSFTSAGAGVDIHAQRAYLRSAAGGGSEVPAPAVGQTVYFTLDWRLIGPGGSVSVAHRAVLDGSTFCSFGTSVTPGSYNSWCATGWVATAGTHTLQWDLDYTNAVPESNESNNSASTVFTPSSSAPLDIEAQRAFLRTAANGGTEVDVPAIGQPVFFHVDWRVTGSGGSVTVTLRALIDGVLFCSCATAAVPGSSYVSSCTLPWTAIAGTHELRWELDYESGVAETNEGNNTATKIFTPQAQAPGAFTKVSPANGAAGQGTNPTLTWMSSTGAASYEYCLDTTADSACGTSWISVGTATSALAGGLANGVTYSWQVRSVNPAATTHANGGVWWSFTTAAQTSAITIIKDAVPNHPRDFAFTTTGGLTPATFGLDDDGDAALPDSRMFNDLPAGTYTVTEVLTNSGFSLTSLVCVDPDGGTSTNLSSATATIDLDAGELITCTFTNTAIAPSLTIVLDTAPNGPQDFGFTTTGGLSPAAFSLDDDGDPALANTRVFSGLAAGSYTVTQSQPVAGFALASLVCSDGGGGLATHFTSATATVDLDAGRAVTCTFRNSPLVPPNSGAEFRVNTHTPSDQVRPSVAVDAAGNFIVVWENLADAQGTAGVSRRRFASSGLPIEDDVELHSYSTGDQRRPDVQYTPSGGFVATWQSTPHDGSDFGVFTRIFDETGTPAAAEFQVNQYTTHRQTDPRVAVDGAGNFVVAWTGYYQIGWASEVFARRYSSSGAPLSDEIQLNNQYFGFEFGPSIVRDAGGSFVVAWEGFADNNPSYGIGVFARRFNPTGTPQENQALVNTYTSFRQTRPSIGADGAGNFVVVWQSERQDDPGGSSYSYGIFARVFHGSGAPLTGEIPVNTYTTGSQVNPSVAVDRDGSFMVVWEADVPEHSRDIRGRRFSSGGTPLGDEFGVAEHVQSDQRRPRVAVDERGDFVVVWQTKYPQGGDGYEISGRRFFPHLNFRDGFDAGSLNAWSQSIVDGGDLAVTPAAAMAGSAFGIRATIDDTAPLYVLDTTPNGERVYTASFFLNTGTFDPGEAFGRRRTRIFIVFGEGPRRLAAVVLRRLNGEYAIIGRARRDDNSQARTSPAPITPGIHHLQVELSRATAPGASDGRFRLWIDGVLAAELTAIDNDESVTDFVRLGAMNVKMGANGFFDLDQFEARAR
jgi:hypothetical protein